MKKKFIVKIKEVGRDNILTTEYSGSLGTTRQDIVEFYGLNGSDVEWYDIKEVY